MTKIEWADVSWNPVTGCSPAGEGCLNCYARAMAKRLKAMGQPKYANGFKVTCHPDELKAKVLRKRKPQRIFVNSMSDLFHEDVPDEFLDWVFATMASNSRHVYVVLTKRPERMRAYYQRLQSAGALAGKTYEARMRKHFETYKMKFLEGYSLPGPPTPELRFIYDSASQQEERPLSPDGTTLRYGFSGGEYHWQSWPLPNVQLGVSVSTQREADEWVPVLEECSAAVRVVSNEPAIEPIDWGPHLRRGKIGWFICGCESGPKRRPFSEHWARCAQMRCATAGVPFFFKQGRDERGRVVKMPLLDGRRWEEYP